MESPFCQKQAQIKVNCCPITITAWVILNENLKPSHVGEGQFGRHLDASLRLPRKGVITKRFGSLRGFVSFQESLENDLIPLVVPCSFDSLESLESPTFRETLGNGLCEKNHFLTIAWQRFVSVFRKIFHFEVVGVVFPAAVRNLQGNFLSIFLEFHPFLLEI